MRYLDLPWAMPLPHIPVASPDASLDAVLADHPLRDLSFIGIGHAGPDLVRNSQEILWAELGGGSEQ
jgi:hypothetical protein